MRNNIWIVSVLKKVVDAFFLEKWLWSLFGDLINEKFFLLGLEHALTLAIVLQNCLNPSSLRPAKSFPLFLLSKRVYFNLNPFLCPVKQLFPCNRLPFSPLFFSHQRVLILIPTTALFLSDCPYLQSTWTALRSSSLKVTLNIFGYEGVGGGLKVKTAKFSKHLFSLHPQVS